MAAQHSGDVVQDILGEFASHSPYTLADSIHAPRHIRSSVAANSNNNSPTTGRYTNARDTMRGVPSVPLATLYEADPTVDTSRIEDTDAFAAAMNARIGASKAKSSGSSAKTMSSDTTITATSSATVKNKENQPLSKEEVRELLVSPTKKGFKESKEGM